MFLNGAETRLQRNESVDLNEGDKFRIGDYEFEAVIEDPALAGNPLTSEEDTSVGFEAFHEADPFSDTGSFSDQGSSPASSSFSEPDPFTEDDPFAEPDPFNSPQKPEDDFQKANLFSILVGSVVALFVSVQLHRLFRARGRRIQRSEDNAIGREPGGQRRLRQRRVADRRSGRRRDRRSGRPTNDESLPVRGR